MPTIYLKSHLPLECASRSAVSLFSGGARDSWGHKAAKRKLLRHYRSFQATRQKTRWRSRLSETFTHKTFKSQPPVLLILFYLILFFGAWRNFDHLEETRRAYCRSSARLPGFKQSALFCWYDVIIDRVAMAASSQRLSWVLTEERLRSCEMEALIWCNFCSPFASDCHGFVLSCRDQTRRSS